jgi:hypothetical protein
MFGFFATRTPTTRTCLMRQFRSRTFGRRLSYMERNPPYFRISELLEMVKYVSAHPSSKSDHALGLIEETFYAIEEMSIAEREDLMNRIEGWMLVDKFDTKGHSALLGLQRYCIAECLLANPRWVPSQAISKRLLPRAY